MYAQALITSISSVFKFNPYSIRAFLIDDQSWFVAADVCVALDIGNTTMALRNLDEDEQALSTIEGLSKLAGGNEQVNIINESGLYSLILRSRKPEAKRFKKWVTSEVLPAIRKTGQYQKPPQTLGKLGKEITQYFLHWHQRYCFRAGSGFAYRIHAALRNRYNVKRVEDIPIVCLNDLTQFLDQSAENARRINHICELIEQWHAQNLHCNINEYIEIPPVLKEVLPGLMKKLNLFECFSEGPMKQYLRSSNLKNNSQQHFRRLS